MQYGTALSHLLSWQKVSHDVCEAQNLRSTHGCQVERFLEAAWPDHETQVRSIRQRDVHGSINGVAEQAAACTTSTIVYLLRSIRTNNEDWGTFYDMM